MAVDPDLLVKRHLAGTLPPWARWLVIAACAVSILLAFVGPQVLWDEPTWKPRAPLYCLYAVGFGVLVSLVVVVATDRVDRYVQLAVALPLIHLLALATIWVMSIASPPIPTSDYVRPPQILELLTVGRVVVGAVVFVGVAGAIIGRREALHAIVMLALLAALFVGAWLPIISRLPWGHSPDNFEEVRLTPALLGYALAPPLGAAIAATIALFRSPATSRRAHAITFGSIVAVGMLASLHMPLHAVAVYDNFIHVVAVLAGIGIIGLGALAVSIWRDRRHARRALARPAIAGRIADDAGEVARIEIASWLRGPRAVVGPFTVITRDGAVHVPGGRLLASLEPETTQLTDGESLVALRAGDPVVLTGFVTQEQDGHPFRSSSVPVAAGRVFVTRTGDGSTAAKTIGYALWRPSIAYLVVLVAIGLTSLIVATTYSRTPSWSHYSRTVF